MYEVYALKCAERDTPACQFFSREASQMVDRLGVNATRVIRIA